MKVTAGILITLFIVVIIGLLGLKVRPQSFSPYPVRAPNVETTPLPVDLPAPVERFYRTVYGDQIPVIKSAVISGQARLRLLGITFPGRFRFTHIAGRDYHHYIEATFFGLPVMKVNEYFITGNCRLELPFKTVEGEPNINQAANLGLWAESFVWLPALLVTDPRVQWESIDDQTALLRVPFGEVEESLVAHFDTQSGMLRILEAMRYKEATDKTKTLWVNEAREWRDITGHTLTAVVTTSWIDEGNPWAAWVVEEVVYNTDVSEVIRSSGP